MNRASSLPTQRRVERRQGPSLALVEVVWEGRTSLESRESQFGDDYDDKGSSMNPFEVLVVLDRVGIQLLFVCEKPKSDLGRTLGDESKRHRPG